MCSHTAAHTKRTLTSKSFLGWPLDIAVMGTQVVGKMVAFCVACNLGHEGSYRNTGTGTINSLNPAKQEARDHAVPLVDYGDWMRGR